MGTSQNATRGNYLGDGQALAAVGVAAERAAAGGESLEPTAADALLNAAYRRVSSVLLEEPAFLDMLHLEAVRLQNHGATDVGLLFEHVASQPNCPKALKAWAHFKMGQLLRLSGDAAGARAALGLAIEAVPGHVKARLALLPEDEPLVLAYGKPDTFAPQGFAVDFFCNDRNLWRYWLGDRPADELWIIPALRVFEFEAEVLAEVLDRWVRQDGWVCFPGAEGRRLCMEVRELREFLEENGPNFRQAFEDLLTRNLVD